MSRHQDGFPPRQVVEVFESRWQQLCDLYLPIAGDLTWRYSRELLPNDALQGWKLHVSATILTAPLVLRSVSPLLHNRGVLYKAPGSLLALQQLNSGILGYSQIGKFITVYPGSDEEALLLAQELHRLTRGMSAPSIPFDGKYRSDSCVSYRYGAFHGIDAKRNEGEPVVAIRDPEGRRVEDVRESGFKPDWVVDPFAAKLRKEAGAATKSTPLKTRFRAFRALAQRGRGGVYQAIDLAVEPPRFSVLKEGRKDGEVDWEGRDGVWRIKHERRVLNQLRKNGVNVPRVYSSFKAQQNHFLAIEFIDGEDLGSWLRSKRRRISIHAALRLGGELARILSRTHAAGWVWRDCKPANIMITKRCELRPLDFEGACPVNRPDSTPWGTPAYTPPEANDDFNGQSRLPEDLYALGAVIYFLLAGRTPDQSAPIPLTKFRKNVPRAASAVVMELLSRDPQRRPTAQCVAERLKSVGLKMGSIKV